MLQTEVQTRKEIIDKLLVSAGWDVDDPTRVVSEFDISVKLPDGVSEPQTPYQGHQFSDYVLLGKDGKPLAVVEAKKTSKDAGLGREQVKQYCYNIQKQLGGELPFCFYTNGHEIYFWDLDNYPPRKVVGFPTRDDLERFQYIRRNRKPLTRELRTQLRSNSAEKGEVLWQGRRGICVALESTSQSGRNVRVFCLQDPEGDTAFVKDFLMPVREVLDAHVLPITDEFGEAQRKAVGRAMKQLSAIGVSVA